MRECAASGPQEQPCGLTVMLRCTIMRFDYAQQENFRMKLSLRDMKEATKLTQSGRLVEATALIQQLLSKGQAMPSHDVVPPLWQPTLLPSGRVAESVVEDVPLSVSLTKHRNAEPVAKKASLPFETKNFSCASGQRNYKLFTPRIYSGSPLPLIVMLHGCTQSPDDFAAGTQMNQLADEIGFFVAYPAQSSSANSMGCWNWFKSSDQQKDKGEPALVAGITRQIMAEHAVDAQKVYVAGFSAGGAMAAVLGMTYPDLFAAIGVHSGLPCGAATDMMGAMKVMKRGGSYVPDNASLNAVPTIVFHGDKDRTVHPANARDVIAQFISAGSHAQFKTTAGKSKGNASYSHSVHSNESGIPVLEQWEIQGAGHAWSGGSSKGSYTEPHGPDASREMVRFFFEHKLLAT